MTVLETDTRTLPRLPLVEVVVQQSDLLRPDWLATQLDDVLRVRPDRVVVDVSRCSRLDAASLQVLLGMHCELRRRRAVLVLRGLSPRLERVIAIGGLAEVFDVEGRPRC